MLRWLVLHDESLSKIESMLNSTLNELLFGGSTDPGYSELEAAANIYKTLKPGGSCFIMVYNHYSFRNILLSNYHLFIKGKIFKGHNYKSIATKFTDGYYQKHYKKNELYKILKNIGYKNIELSIGHHKGKILPFLKSHNSILGRYLSKKFGYFLYAKFQKK